MKSIFLTGDHTKLVQEFCDECKKHGYLNNSSLKLMKFNGEYDLKEIPCFWGIYHDKKLISISGSHCWYGQGELEGVPFMRCLFRSATLPEYQKLISGLSKNHMNSLPFGVLLPYQINKGLREGVEHFYITTSNGDHDASGKMKRTHRILQLLEKTKIVKYAGDGIFYSTPQTKWELNVVNYYETLKKFHPTRLNYNIDVSQEYLSIIENGFEGVWKDFMTPKKTISLENL